MAASGSSYREVHMKIHKLQHNSTLDVFWISNLRLCWANYFAHLPAYTPKSTCWAEVSKVTWENPPRAFLMSSGSHAPSNAQAEGERAWSFQPGSGVPLKFEADFRCRNADPHSRGRTSEVLLSDAVPAQKPELLPLLQDAASVSAE